MSPDALPEMTVEQYLAFERAETVRHEFFNGEVFAMSGASVVHNRIMVNFVNQLSSALGTGPC